MAKNSLAKLRSTLAICLLLAILVAVGLAVSLSPTNCNRPVFLARGTNVLGNPIPRFAAIIRREGGLPRTSSEMDSEFTFPSSTITFPVFSWRIAEVGVGSFQDTFARILDDDPTYQITVDVEVNYRDGSDRLLRWSTWRYGLVLCPVVIPYGDGPPWQVTPLD